MPQLSLYLDDATMEQLRADAAAANMSLSGYARKRLSEKPANNGWPEGWFDLYGSVTDETFVEPPDLTWEEDRARLIDSMFETV